MQKKLFFLIFFVCGFSTIGLSQKKESQEELFEQGYIYFLHNEYKKAASFFKAFIAQENIKANPSKYRIAQMHRYLAQCYDKMFLIRQAVDEYQLAAELFIELNDSAKIALNFEDMAAVFNKQNKPEQSSYFLKEALHYYEKEKWLSKLQSGYLQMGILEIEKANYDLSVNYLGKALSVNEEYKMSSDYAHIHPDVYYYLADASLHQKKYSEAIEFIQTGEEYCRKLVNQLNHLYRQWVDLKLLKVKLLLETGKMEDAYKEIRLAENIISQNKWLNLLDLVNMAKINYFDLTKQFKEADKIVSEWYPDLTNGSGLLPESRYYPEILKTVSNHYQFMFQASRNFEFLEKKLIVLEQFCDNNLMNSIVFPFLCDHAFYGKQNIELFDEIIKCAFDLYETTGNKEYINKAFQFTEQFNYGIRVSELEQGTTGEGESGKKNKFDELIGLKSEINSLLASYYKDTTGNKSSRDELIRSIFRFEEIQKCPNKLYLREIQPLKKPILSLQKNLAENETYLKFYETNEAVFLFLITRDNLSTHQIFKDSLYSKHARQVADFIRNKGASVTLGQIEDYIYPANFLYQKLLFPYEKRFAGNKLIIEWENQKNKFPFEVLLFSDSVPVSLNMQKMPFLIKKMDIRYSGSVRLFINGLTRKQPVNHMKYMGFAPFGDNAGKNLPSLLPHSGNEVKGVSGLTGGKAFLGKKATKKLFLEKGTDTDILHIATHAQNNPVYPELAELNFVDPNSGDTENLYYYEIANGKWNNRLAILDACNSSEGEYLIDYGTSSLSNAFRGAGVKGVIGANWEANDFVSSQIITSMICNLKDGMEAGQALRKAKIDFLNQAPDLFSLPNFWAVYTYHGPRQFINLKDVERRRVKEIYMILFLIPVFYFVQKFLRRRVIIRRGIN
jgi:CHAT domain-containing protein